MKVLVNGCSHIEGTGLHDDSQKRMLMTWPNLVPNWQVTNIAEAASSNDSICRRTIDHLSGTKVDYDFVYIQWSYFDRIELQIPFWDKHNLEKEWFCINAANVTTQLRLNNHDSFIHQIAESVYLKQFNHTWLYRLSLMSITTLYHYLTRQGIDFMFGFSYDQLNKSDIEWFDRSKINQTSWINFCNKKFKFADNNQHYNHLAHIEYSKLIDKLINHEKST
jgi:hypothetical protein